MATLAASNITSTGVTLTSSGAGTPTNTRYWYFRITLNGEFIGSRFTSNKSTSGRYTFSNLSGSNNYYAECRYGSDLDALREWANGSGSTSGTYNGGSCYFTTLPDYPTNDTGTLELTADYGQLYVYINNFTERSYPRTLVFECSSGTESYSGTVYLHPAYANEPEYTFKGLTGNKTYTIKVTSYNPDEKVSYTATSSEYVKQYYSTDSATYRSVIGVETITLILENITSRDYYRTVVFTWKNNSTGNSGSKRVTLFAGETSISVDMENLSPDTSYTFSITMTNPAIVTTYSSGKFILTTKDYNYILTISSFSTSNTVGVDIKLSQAQDFDIPIKVYLDGACELTDTLSAGTTSLKKTYLSNITPATAYKITVYDGKRQKSFNLTKRTKNNFKWSTNVASGEEFSLLATDWNEYISQLKSKAIYFGYTDYSPADVSKGDTFTAVKFKGAATVINWLVNNNKGDCKTKIDTTNIVKGKGVYASDILSLASCLNE